MKIEQREVEDYYAGFSDVLSDGEKRKGLLIHAFQRIQKEHNYLPETELKGLSENLGLPLAEVYSAASFYKHFYFKPRGKNIVCVCTGTACHVRGAAKILEKVEDTFGIKPGETTPDLSVTLETVGCVGCCGLAPVVTVNEDIFGDLSPKKTDKMLSQVLG